MSLRDLGDTPRRYAGQAGQLVSQFYVPVLGQATRYDRQAGYFDSATLVQLASGLAAFIHRLRTLPPPSRAPMRLVTGATWGPDDLAAYQRGVEALQGTLGRSLLGRFEPSDAECVQLGLPPGWRPEDDQIARHRLGALAWMVAAGLLEVRVALPLDSNGRPYLPGRHGALYHPKAGLLYDEAGDVLYFQGSVNETGAAWTRNREKFDVKRSWFSAQDAEDIRAEIEEFERIWRGREPGLLVLPLPRAVEEYLSAFVPTDGPDERDPMELDLPAHLTLRDRIAAQWLLDAPRRPGGDQLVLAPLILHPYPHQGRVAERVAGGYPRAFMFCDQVGLGKTIEAGLALRTLILRGDVQRALILAPRGLVRQWQEELREKFALTAWFYDGQCLRDVAGRVRMTDRPWDEAGVVIASRQLVVRVDRRDELLAVRSPWDVVVVDEAHAARQTIFGGSGPNQTLSLLQELRRRELYRSLWLLTATPMQLDPHEVHDLLLLCGLDDPGWDGWTTLAGFRSFFEQLRVFPQNRDARPSVMELARVAVGRGAPELDRNRPPAAWSGIGWAGFVSRARGERPGLALGLQTMTGSEAEAISPFLARQTPLAVHMFRHTRATLRALQERGLVRGLAKRAPEDLPVEFQTVFERDLYLRIDELCSRFYRLADLPPDERNGVGFLMAVFRKRLASCFYALKRSLERRRDLIVAVQQRMTEYEALLDSRQEAAEEDEDDDEAPDPALLLERERRRLVRLADDPRRREQLERERLYLQEYITALGQVAVDSKFQTFRDRLAQMVAAGERVIVFTQYVDTLDFIRDQLVARFGDRLACYSGRGGEVWDPGLNTWRVVDKAEVKSRARRDHPRAVQILLGSDAASEGINLQEFSTLINYDLPWNPMRVEQRIGRIDRIGQDAEVVRILNLYVRGTIEEDTYHTLKERIGAFEEVVGPLQPILAEMPRILGRLARGEIELDEARRQLDEAARTQPNVPIAKFEEYVLDDVPETPGAVDQPPATQQQLAAWCLAHPAPGMRVMAVPEPGLQAVEKDGTRACHAVTWPDAPAVLGIDSAEEILVTFNAELADRHPPTAAGEGDDGLPVPGQEGVRLLTWGDPYLAAWLEAVRGEPLTDDDYHAAGVDAGTNPLR